MIKFGQWVMRLSREMIPPFVFFFVAFELLALSSALMLRQYGIGATRFAVAAVEALVVAKVLVLADMLPFINRFPHKPLIFNIAWKTPIYFAAAFAARYAEELFHAYRKTGGLASAYREVLDQVVWTQFWMIQLWLTVLLLVYCTSQELVRNLGRDRVRELFFGARTKASESDPAVPPIKGK